MRQRAIPWERLCLFGLWSQLSNWFHTSVASEIKQFRQRDLLRNRALNCECMTVETRLWDPTYTIYYEINVVVDKVMGLRKHGYNVSIHHIKNHLCLEEWKLVKKPVNLAWQITALPDTPSTICSTWDWVNAMYIREHEWKAGRYSEIPLIYILRILCSEKGKGVSMADRWRIEEPV